MTSVRAIFEEHADFVWRVLARAGVRDADLKDASQEVFIVVASKLDQLERAQLEGTKTTSWLYAVAIRVGANHRRKVQRKREELTDTDDEGVAADASEGPEEAVLRAQACARLADLLDELPAEQRIVFELFELEEMTCPAIADQLGIPLGTVYTRLRTARIALAAKVQWHVEREQ